MFLKTLYKRSLNDVTPKVFVGACFGVAIMLIGFLPYTRWKWIPPEIAEILVILGVAILALCVAWYVIGIIKNPIEKAYPSRKVMFGIKKSIWQLYKLEQSKVEKAGVKGLNPFKLNQVMVAMRHDLKVAPKIIYTPLTEEETNRIIASTNKRLGIKAGQVTNKTVEQLIIAGTAVDKCNVGVSSLVEGDGEYEKAKNSLNTTRLHVKKDKRIKELKRLSYSLNTTLLVILYFEHEGLKKAPSLKIPHGLMKQALDEEMQRQLEEM